jgi:ubiquinone/menaquinone biosynthesis C-methylase UbiE
VDDSRARTMRAYYEQQAHDYDRRTASPAEGAERSELRGLARFVAELPACRVLDVACGTGTLTQHLQGSIVGVDQSQAMLDLAARRLPAAKLVRSEVPPLPFSDRAFDRVFTSSFYSHLPASETRRLFVSEALRVARELIVVEVARQPGQPPSATEVQVAPDGQKYAITKRFWTAEELARELGGSVLYDQGFIAARVASPAPT